MTSQSVEVLVIGSGVNGGFTAYHAALQGRRVLVLERAEPGVEPAASWASAGGVRRQGRDAAEVPLAIEAIERWRTLEAELDADLSYRRDGNLKLAESEVASILGSPKDLDARYSSGASDFKADKVVTGRIVDIRNNEVVIDIGYKSEGIVPASEFQNIDEVDVDDEVDVLLESVDDGAGGLRLSKRRADRLLPAAQQQLVAVAGDEGHQLDAAVAVAVLGGDAGRCAVAEPGRCAGGSGRRQPRRATGKPGHERQQHGQQDPRPWHRATRA